MDMTTQDLDDEHPQSIIKLEDEELSEKSVQEMKPPMDSKVPISSKIFTKKIKTKSPHTCKICQKTFKTREPLRYHIREMYFNLKAKTLIYEMKKVKQSWVEKVVNSNELVEITKTGPNSLLMRKTERNAIIESDVEIEEIDLSYIYPINSKYKLKECTICEVEIPRKIYKKHIVSHMI